MLTELVSGIDGAEGALLMDKEGEAVQWYARNNVEQLQLRGACLAVVIGACRTLAERIGAGQTRQIILNYEGARFVIEALPLGYFVLLELSLSSNLGQALQKIQPAVAKIREEMGD
jgi:predicted regulator of Ras-like GTPase activity (Roadblock/LC7/MglB family)